VRAWDQSTHGGAKAAGKDNEGSTKRAGERKGGSRPQGFRGGMRAKLLWHERPDPLYIQREENDEGGGDQTTIGGQERLAPLTPSAARAVKLGKESEYRRSPGTATSRRVSEARAVGWYPLSSQGGKEKSKWGGRKEENRKVRRTDARLTQRLRFEVSHQKGPEIVRG